MILMMKRNATKMYLDQVHQRLYLEQTLLVERIKHTLLLNRSNK